MDTLQCAVVLAKLERFEWEIIQRQAIGELYNKEIDQLGIDRVRQKADRTSVFAQYTLRIRRRDALIEHLKSAEIPAVVHYPLPLNEQPAYQHLCCSSCTPVASTLARAVVSLPMSPYLTDDKLKHVIQVLSNAHL